jgi:hypothetical protein
LSERLIIAGSRSLVPKDPPEQRRAAWERVYAAVDAALANRDFEISEVVSGAAWGPDTIGERWARDHNIAVRQFHPNWRLGKQAGITRNIEMGKYATRGLVLWDGVSHGSKQMIDWLRMYGKPCQVVEMEIPCATR